MAIEVEWMVGRDADDFEPAFGGTGYGLSRFLDAADYVRDVLESLEAAGVRVEQIHPEYGPGPVRGLGRPRRTRCRRPTPTCWSSWSSRRSRPGMGCGPRSRLRSLSDNVGNGGHLHASFWQDGQNLLAGGPGRHGLTGRGRVDAGEPAGQPARAARHRRADRPSSYLRLQPSRWAGAFQVWGRENREAAVRFVAGSPADPGAANVELKCFDLSANPYLLVGAVMAVALDGARPPGQPAGRGHRRPGRAGAPAGRPAAPGCRAAWPRR